jgi:hypothetical protein
VQARRPAGGTLWIEAGVEAQVTHYRDGANEVTTMRGGIFSTPPGSPAWLAKATTFRARLPEYGVAWQFEGRSAIQATFRFTA